MANNQRNVFEVFNDVGDFNENKENIPIPNDNAPMPDYDDDMVISDDELEIIDYEEISKEDLIKQQEDRDNDKYIDDNTFQEGLKKYEAAQINEMCIHCGLYKPDKKPYTGTNDYKRLYSKYRKLHMENKHLYEILNEMTEKMMNMDNKMKQYERFSELVINQEYQRHIDESEDIYEFQRYDSPISPDSTSFINAYNYNNFDCI